MRGRMLIIGLALAAVAIAFVASARRRPQAAGAGDRDRDAAGGPAPANALKLTLVYSPEKELLLAPLIKRFNAERHESGGRIVVVDARIVASGDAETQIAKGTLRPALWSPASSFWGRLLNYEADRRLVADENPSIVRTPLVIAMFKQLADAYGYPQAQARLQGARRARHRRLGGGRQAAVRHVQVRAHQPGLLDLGPLRGRRLLLRGGRQEGGPDRGRRHPRAPAGAAARALDRALRRHDALHRRRDAPARARLRLGRRRWRRRR